MKKKMPAILTGLFVLILQLAAVHSFAQGEAKDFEKMAGTRFVHPIIDKSDSLSAKEVIELRDSEGIPAWFNRDIFKNVCLTGECRMVRLRIYWDGAGNYLGLKINENEPLTKTDHTVFNREDYLKLDHILGDSLSVLKRLNINDLTVERENESKLRVDGITGATMPTIYESVVRNAVYTTYTLWHTVYGPTRQFIMSLMEESAGREYLQRLFTRQNPNYLVWAIDFLERHPQYQVLFYPEIIKCIQSKDYTVFRKAVEYFTPVILSDNAVQKDLARVAGEPSILNRYEILRKFSALPSISNDAVLLFLEQYEKQQISAGLLGYVMDFIRPENLENEYVARKIKKLAKDKNLYVRNLAEDKLKAGKNQPGFQVK